MAILSSASVPLLAGNSLGDGSPTYFGVGRLGKRGISLCAVLCGAAIITSVVVAYYALRVLQAGNKVAEAKDDGEKKEWKSLGERRVGLDREVRKLEGKKEEMRRRWERERERLEERMRRRRRRREREMEEMRWEIHEKWREREYVMEAREEVLRTGEEALMFERMRFHREMNMARGA
ncbi:hypothetical protein TWF281_008423 [Arthrobotrys megalospora]